MSTKRFHVPLTSAAEARLKKVISDANADFLDGRVTPGDVLSLAIETAKIDLAMLKLRATRPHLVLKRLIKEGVSCDPTKAAEQLQAAAMKFRMVGRAAAGKEEDLPDAKSG